MTVDLHTMARKKPACYLLNQAERETSIREGCKNNKKLLAGFSTFDFWVLTIPPDPGYLNLCTTLQPGIEVVFNTSLSISTKCQLHILAVGGGGAGASGGGGSGYIKEVTHNFTSTPTLIKLFVGNKGRVGHRIFLMHYGTSINIDMIIGVYQKCFYQGYIYIAKIFNPNESMEMYKDGW